MDLEMRNIVNAFTLPDTELKTELKEDSCSNESPKAISEPESPTQKQHEEIKSVKPQNKRKKPPEKLVIKRPRDNEYEGDSDSEEDYDLCVSDGLNEKVKESDEIEESETIDIMKDETIEIQRVVRNTEDSKNVIDKLDDDKMNGKKLYAKSSGNYAEFMDDTSLSTEVSSHSCMVPDEDVRDSDPLGLYGLKMEFLESLGITPPLDRWVHVANFRCDKFELRDVMELAGQVLSCSVININKRFAKVQYSHPLEAVQAVSMLNGQMYFGLKLRVYLEKNPKNDIILPKGLVNIGLGLGLQGRPVRDIAQQFRKYARHQKSVINPILFRKINYGYRNYSEDKTNEGQMDIEEFVASSKTSTFANNRSFNIKHVEDLDNNDDTKEKSTRRNSSPESNSDKSVGSPACVVKEDKPNDLKVISTQPDSQRNSALPLSLSQGKTAVTYHRPKIPQNRPLQPQMTPAVPYRPCPSLLEAQPNNIPYTGPFKPGPVCNAVPNHILNAVVNQSPQTAALSLSYVPIPAQGPAVSGPVNRPVHMPGPGSIPRPPNYSGPGPVPTPGPIHRPGLTPGPGMASGPGFPASGPVHGPQPVSAIGTGPVIRPAPITGALLSAGGHNKFTVQLANLPPSTTFPFLCEKLTHCGQVLSLQFTTPGCAVATFSHPTHAERCFQAYNGMTVEGCRINVTLA